MPSGSDAAHQLALVEKAITSGLGGCFEWEERAREKVRCDPFFQGIQPNELKRLAVDYVRQGGRIKQRQESDEEWVNRREFDYWYSICFEVAGLDAPVFMKTVLHDDDEEYPEARIVGAHKSP